MEPDSEKSRSLPRLLALEKNFASYNEKLDEAITILGLPTTNLLNEQGEFLYFQDDVPQDFELRAAWVLRWLLNKLRSQQSDGKEARGHERSWRLVGLLVLSLPNRKSTEVLNSLGFLDILQRTLEEIFGFVEDGLCEISVETTIHSPKVKTKKRKRAGTPVEETADSQLLQEEKSRSLEVIFESIYSALTTVVSKSGLGINGVRFTRDHKQSVLKLDSDKAATLLCFWLKAIQVLNIRTYEDPYDGVSGSISPLTPMAKIWNFNRYSGSTEDTSADNVFNDKCLLPAISLLAKTRQNERNEPSPSNAVKVVRRELETMLLSHVLAPARAASLINNAEACSKILEDSFRTLRSKISSLAKQQSEGMAAEFALRNLLTGTQHIFTVALGTTPRKTPKQRLTEGPWLLALFKELAHCALCPVDQKLAETPLDLSIKTLVGILRIAKENHFVLHSSTLESMIERYSGLVSKPSAPCWPLISAILQADPSPFLLVGHQGSEPEVEAKPRLTNILFKAISVAERNADTRDEEIRDDALLTKRILLPIMEYHAATRNLTQFLEEWFSHIVQVRTRRQSSTELSSVWESKCLNNSLKPLLIESLPSLQLYKAIGLHITNVVQTTSLLAEGVKDMIKDRQAVLGVASCTVLHALLEGLSRNELPEDLIQSLRKVETALRELVTFKPFVKSAPMDTIWKLLSQLYSLLFPLFYSGLSVEEHRTWLTESAMQSVFSASGKAVKSAISKRSKQKYCEIAYEAFAYVLNIWSGFAQSEESPVDFNEIISPAVLAFTSTLDTNTISISTSIEVLGPHLFEHRLSCVLLDYPEIILNLSSSNRVRIFQSALARMGVEKTSNPSSSSPAYLLMSAFVELALSSPSPKVRGDMVAVLLPPFSSRPLGLSGSKKVGKKHSLAYSVMELMSTVPASTIAREDREQMLDHMLSLFEKDHSFDELSLGKTLAAFVRLLEVPNATAKICIDPQVLWDMALKIPIKPGCLDHTDAFRELMRLILKHVSANKDQPRSKTYLETMQQLLVDNKGSETTNTGLSLLRDIFDTASTSQPPESGSHKTTSKTSLNALLNQCRSMPLHHDMSVESLGAYGRALGDTQRAFESTDLSTKLQVAAVLFKEGDNSSVATNSLSIFGILLESLDPKQKDKESHTLLIEHISKLCGSLEQHENYSTFSLVVSCIDIVLKKKHWVLSQYAVDELLTSLNNTAVHISNGSSTSPPMAYLRLCSLANTLVSLHRLKLGGRAHLVLKPLQSLLTALYTSPNSTKLHPSHKTMLTHEHAEAYSRVLQTLCSPTVSSVSRHNRSQNELVDEVTKAKKDVAEYIGGVLAAFCEAQLNFQLAEGMRDKLNPGLYSVMDVMGEDGLRVLSSGLYSNTRAVLRSLVSDWKKSERRANR